MCGIVGVLRFNGRPVEPEVVQRMTDTLAHRGPDGDGIHTAGPVGLGHRRLAIIDLTAAGRQPLANDRGDVWVTFNGEIYNYRDLRSELERQGHRFRSATDTEVIVHAYEAWGVDCVKRFNGMFAFGLWDARQQKLWLVRDRIGVKPLFYCRTSQGIFFGSEIKAIIRNGEVDRAIDFEALSYYLALNYTPAPYTLFVHVRQLLPGHYLWVDASGTMRDVEYWDLVYREDDVRPEKEYCEELFALLQDSVRLRLVSDVPFGVFLSGGMDSSAVAYLMSRLLRSTVQSFSIGFNEPSYDELPYARQVARVVGADHHERMIAADAAQILPKIVWHAEEPTADSSMIAVWHVAALARERVKMVLSGDGADEIMAGYETYQAYFLLRWYQRLPGWLRQSVIAPIVRSLPTSDAKVSRDFKLKRFAAGAAYAPEDAHATWRIIFDAALRQQLLSPLRDRPEVGADAIDLYRAVFARTNARDPLNRMLYVDTRFYLPNDMLVKVDRMTMAHGLEAREPYLDYRLVEFMARVPSRLKLKNFFHKKYLLKATLDGVLPRQILRRKKQGFNVPVARWIKQGMRPMVTDLLSTAAIRQIGWLNESVVHTILRQHFRGTVDRSHQIWCLLTLVLWWRQFVQNGKQL